MIETIALGLKREQDENAYSNSLFEREHPNLEIIAEVNYGGPRPNDHDIVQISFCPDTAKEENGSNFAFFQRKDEGGNPLGLVRTRWGGLVRTRFNLNDCTKVMRVPYIGAWHQLSLNEAAHYLTFDAHRAYFPIRKWELLCTTDEQLQYTKECLSKYSGKRVFATRPLKDRWKGTITHREF